MTQPIIGLKALKVRPEIPEDCEGHIVSPLYHKERDMHRGNNQPVKAVWDTGHLDALCLCSEQVPEHEPPIPMEIMKAHNITHGCGLYGIWDLQEVIRWANHEDSVLFLVQAEGDTVLHEDGWRAAAVILVAVVSMTPEVEEKTIPIKIPAELGINKYFPTGVPSMIVYVDLERRKAEDITRREEFASYFLGIPVISLSDAYVQLLENHYIHTNGTKDTIGGER